MSEKEVEIIDNVVSDNNTVKDIRDEDTEIMTVNKQKKGQNSILYGAQVGAVSHLHHGDRVCSGSD